MSNIDNVVLPLSSCRPFRSVGGAGSLDRRLATIALALARAPYQRNLCRSRRHCKGRRGGVVERAVAKAACTSHIEAALDRARGIGNRVRQAGGYHQGELGRSYGKPVWELHSNRNQTREWRDIAIPPCPRR